MEQPIQRQPVERSYMRLVVGRKGNPIRSTADDAVSQTAPRRRGKVRPAQPTHTDYVLELTTFHIRPRWLRGRF